MKIFIVNLEREKERREFMKEQFATMNEEQLKTFEVIFFNAIDAKNGGHIHFKQYSPLRSILFRGKQMSDGERACFASHYCLWQKCIELNESIVVLEDDVSLLSNFWDEIRHIRESEYVYVRLMYAKSNTFFHALPDNFYMSFGSLAGSQGYYLTPVAARAFCKGASCWYNPVDDYMDMFYIHNVPNVCIKPVLKEEHVQSTIEGRWSKVKWYLKIPRECSRIYYQCQKYFYLLCCKKNLLLPKINF